MIIIIIIIINLVCLYKLYIMVQQHNKQILDVNNEIKNEINNEIKNNNIKQIKNEINNINNLKTLNIQKRCEILLEFNNLLITKLNITLDKLIQKFGNTKYKCRTMNCICNSPNHIYGTCTFLFNILSEVNNNFINKLNIKFEKNKNYSNIISKYISNTFSPYLLNSINSCDNNLYEYLILYYALFMLQWLFINFYTKIEFNKLFFGLNKLQPKSLLCIYNKNLIKLNYNFFDNFFDRYNKQYINLDNLDNDFIKYDNFIKNYNNIN